MSAIGASHAPQPDMDGAPASPEIREACEADVGALLDLYEAAGLDATGSNDRADALRLYRQVRAAGATVLLAESDGRPVGTLTLFVLPLLAHRGRPEAVVEDVAVHRDAQGRGIGRALLHEAMRRAQAAACYKLALSSNARRTDAHAFYDHLGFQRHGLSFVVDLPEHTR